MNFIITSWTLLIVNINLNCGHVFVTNLNTKYWTMHNGLCLTTSVTVSEVYQNTKLAGCIRFYLATRRIGHGLADTVNAEETAARLYFMCQSRSNHTRRTKNRSSLKLMMITKNVSWQRWSSQTGSYQNEISNNLGGGAWNVTRHPVLHIDDVAFTYIVSVHRISIMEDMVRAFMAPDMADAVIMFNVTVAPSEIDQKGRWWEHAKITLLWSSQIGRRRTKPFGTAGCWKGVRRTWMSFWLKKRQIWQSWPVNSVERWQQHGWGTC